MENRLSSSFRDPKGYMYSQDGKLYRRINYSGKEDYELFINSGLYERLSAENKIVRHHEVLSNETYTIITPEIIPFITYPYEWCFNQYKDAALLTLELATTALEYNMILKDASAYNIQFIKGNPILIDTMSFTKYEEGQPWIAYGQFCRHFLAPLTLMAFCDSRLAQMMRTHLDGIPLDLASKLLPTKTKFSFTLQLHIHQHAKQQRKFAARYISNAKNIRIAKTSLIAILNNLRVFIERLKPNRNDTYWVDYYDSKMNYSNESFLEKCNIVHYFLNKINACTIFDLGANIGSFSSIAAEHADVVVACDIDHGVVEAHYDSIKKSGKTNIYPVVLDITNPSPALGWALKERMSFFERGNFDCVMVLALIHHICISNNVPFNMLAEMLSRLGEWLIIEFVPKSDSQVKKLLTTREDIFPDYNQENFETVFSQEFEIITKNVVPGTERVIYLMRRQRRD